jgi:pimeloyl-ACP methyl ester carboxylesterase
MRRWMAAPLVFFTAFCLIPADNRRALAQKDGPVAETIKTADGVELQSLFYPADPKAAPNAGSAPVVVFLYPPGADRDMTKGDWGGLAKMLNKEGYHVLQFDWRGHGKSNSIKDKQTFWGNVYMNAPAGGFNAYIRGNAPGKLKTDIYFKDIVNPTKFMPAYLNDLAAVRNHLDSKNDNGELNSSSIYIVGAGDAAALGMAWLTAEWKRPRLSPGPGALGVGVPRYEFVPQALVGGLASGSEAGNDFGGAVWLTPSHPASFPGPLIQKWVVNPVFAPKIRENNPMLFVYAEKDKDGKNQSTFFYDEVLVARPKKTSVLEELKQTQLFEVKGGEKLQGIKLLGNDVTLKTETRIIQYFAFIQKERQKIPSKKREYKDPYFIAPLEFGLRP